jgi:hypothetical protein
MEQHQRVLDSTHRADAEIRCGWRSWKVHTKHLQKRLPSLYESLSANKQTFPDRNYTVFVSSDGPVALDDLLYWMYSVDAPQTTPLQRLGEWERTIRLWRIADKYNAFGLTDDICAIILSSRPMSQESTVNLVHIIKALNGSDADFHLQAAPLVKRLIWKNRSHIRDGRLDPALVPTPLVDPLLVKLLNEEVIESLHFREKAAYRNLYFFYWTGSLLRQIHSFDEEKPEDWWHLVAIWEMADRCEYTALSCHLWQTMIDTMSLRHIRNHVKVLRVTSPFIALSNGSYIAKLQIRFLQKILEECPLMIDQQNSWSHLPVLDALCMCDCCRGRIR